MSKRYNVSLRVTVIQKLYPYIQQFSTKRLFCIFEIMSVYYPIKVRQNCFDSFSRPNQTGMQIFKFSFALDK